jgi:M6 family metalloprotease-like protein
MAAKAVALSALVAFCGVLSASAADASAVDPLAACRLPEMQLRSDVGLGFPRNPLRLRTLGEVRFRVLFVDFSDAPATVSPQQVLDIISPRAEQFFSAVSYGRMKLVFDVSPQWIRMRQPVPDYHFGRGAPFEVQRAYLQEAINLAGPGIDYSHNDAILVVANPDAKAIDWGPAFTAAPGSGVMAGGREFFNGATSGADLPILRGGWFVHEIGHALSLVDLAGPLPSNQLWHTYVGQFSVMGEPEGLSPGYLGWERWQLGWLDDQQIACGAGTVRLTPIERSGNVKIAVMPTGPHTAVVAESRRAEAEDSAMPRSGVLVYTVDTALTSHDGPIRVQPVDDRDERHWKALLSAGQSVSAGEVTVTVKASDGQGDLVEIIRRPRAPAPLPTVH